MTAPGARGSLALLAGSPAMLFAATSALVAVGGLAGFARANPSTRSGARCPR